MSGLYLLSDMGRSVTGEVHHVDSGYHLVGMLNTSSAQELSKLLEGFDVKS